LSGLRVWTVDQKRWMRKARMCSCSQRGKWTGASPPKWLRHCRRGRSASGSPRLATALSRRASGRLVERVAKWTMRISYANYPSPPEIIQRAIWLHLRFTLNFRDVEDFAVGTWRHGLISNDSTLGEPFRTEDCRGLARAPLESRQDMVSRRGLSKNRWPRGLSVASGRC
jgi:hypothetical protein